MKILFGNCDCGTIRDLLIQLVPDVPCYNWLFVALDSLRGADLEKSKATIHRQLRDLGLDCTWTDAGFSLDSRAVLTASASQFIVPFSAVYAYLPSHNAPRVAYSATSESSNLAAGMPEALTRSIAQGCAGFFADGVGLDYCVCDENLATAVRRVLEGWGEKPGY